MRGSKLLLVFSLALVLVALPLFSVHPAEFELSFADFFPPTHIHAKLCDSFAKEIGKRTNGRVKITYFPGQALLKAPQIYDGILKGVTDIGHSVFAYTRGRFPVMEAIDLPLGYTKGKQSTCVINEFYQKVKPKELSEVKVLYLHAHPPGLLHSKKPVYKLEDLKGLKIRCTATMAKPVKLLGAVPVSMAMPLTYEALQKGVVDATLNPIETLKGWKHAELIKATTECYSIGYVSGFFVLMNLKKWKALPKDVQKVFDDTSAEWITKHGEGWDFIDNEARKYSLSLGNKVIPLSKEEGARWAKIVAPVIDEWINDAEAKGIPGKKHIKTIRKLMKKCAQQ